VSEANVTRVEGAMPPEHFEAITAMIGEASARSLRGFLLVAIATDGSCGFMGGIRDNGKTHSYSGDEVMGYLESIVDQHRRSQSQDQQEVTR
jgi:hypothetical protein